LPFNVSPHCDLMGEAQQGDEYARTYPYT
jgi:hypothetical protein